MMSIKGLEAAIAALETQRDHLQDCIHRMEHRCRRWSTEAQFFRDGPTHGQELAMLREELETVDEATSELKADLAIKKSEKP